MYIDYRVKRGDSWRFEGERLTKDGTLSPKSITGAVAAEMLSPDGVKTTFDTEIIDANQGLFALRLDPVVTETIEPGVHIADVEFTDSSGAVDSSSTFTITVLKDVTNAA